MEPAKVVKEYKEEITKLQAKVNDYTKVVGKITLEKEWLEGKLEGLGQSLKLIHLVLIYKAFLK